MTPGIEPACRRMEWLDPFYKQVWERAFSEGIPISGTFELTPRCNFNCKMCYVHLKPHQMAAYGRELTAREWLRIALEAREAGTTWVCVTGGEPFLHPEFSTIWEGLTEMGFFLTLQTNASLIRGDIAKLLERRPPRQAKITLYGTTDEVYEAVCGIKDGFTRVNDGIHTLMSLGIPVELVSTVIQQNQQDMKRMAYYAYRHRLNWVPAFGIKPSLRGTETQVEHLRVPVPNETAEETKRRLEWEKAHPFDHSRKPAAYCRDYRLGYWVVWNGMMRFCSFMDRPNIPVRDIPFQEAWQELLDYEESLDWPEACKTCGAGSSCRKCAATINWNAHTEHGQKVSFCTYRHDIRR